MDYICKKLSKKIELYRDRDDFANLKLYLQVKFEYELILIMSYLWNNNMHVLSSEKQEKIYKMIKNPSIGEIVNINRELDVEKELTNAKKVRETINKYPTFRNEKIGHGYSFEDDKDKFIDTLVQMITELHNNVPILKDSYNLVNVEKNINGVLEGILYRADGDYINWNQREKDCSLENALYLTDDKNHYYKISPFIYMEDMQIAII